MAKIAEKGDFVTIRKTIFMAKEPTKSGKLPKGYVDLAFLTSKGEATRVGGHPAFAVETANPSPATGKGGVVLFVPHVSLETYRKSTNKAPKNVLEAAVDHVVTKGKNMTGLGAAMGYAGGSPMATWYGQILDAPGGMLVFVPSVNVRLAMKNYRSWKQLAKKQAKEAK